MNSPAADLSRPETQNAVVLTSDSKLATSVNDKHREVRRLGRKAKEIAADIGEMLIQKKAELKHGEFIPWVEQWCSFSDRRARQYVKVAQTKRNRCSDFDTCTSIADVLALGKTPKAPVQQTRSATLDDLRKVERLRALRDDPSATEGEKENAQRKLDEIEKEIGKVEPEAQRKKVRSGYHGAFTGFQNYGARELAREISFSVACEGCDVVAAKLIENALVKAYKEDHAKLVTLMNNIKGRHDV